MSAAEDCAAFAVPRADRSRHGAGERPAVAPAPQPLLIEAAGHTCLAWWHAPAAIASPALPLAVVLASSWGEEDLAAYDDQRALACALADAGLGALRFEWPDTGDSSAATGSTTLADALAAFDAAAARALALSGHERLAFVGLRLGALLAAHAAAARVDVDALVALMPVAGGNAFVRQQSALRGGLAAPLPGALIDPAELPVSLGGFALPVRRLEALSALRWPAAATTSVLEALLIEPSHAASRAASDALARMGMRVHEQVHAEPSGASTRPEIVRWLRERADDATVLRGVPAIEDFGVADPANARTNAALARARLDAATAAVIGLARAETPVWMRLRQHGVALRERVVRIEDPGEPALVGVLGERDRHDDGAPREAVVLLSSGRERRVGPHRLWVPWARQRAALGDVVLRLDVAGVGDSQPRPHADELERAVAWLRREKGVQACTVVGIGAGATRAWRAALEGLDVRRVIAVDPTRLRPPTSRAQRLLARFDDVLARELAGCAARGVSLKLVLSRDAADRRGLHVAREGGVTISRLAPAHPDFAGVSDKARLYAGLDALLPPPRRDVALRAADAASDAARARRPPAAADVLRAIAQTSRHAA